MPIVLMMGQSSADQEELIGEGRMKLYVVRMHDVYHVRRMTVERSMTSNRICQE